MRFLPQCSTNPRVLRRRGDEPSTARSPLRLRLILSGVAVPVFGTVAVLAVLGLRAGQDFREGLVVLAVLCTALTVAAVIDIAVLRCRLRAARVGVGDDRSPGRAPRGGVPRQRDEPAARKRHG